MGKGHGQVRVCQGFQGTKEAIQLCDDMRSGAAKQGKTDEGHVKASRKHTAYSMKEPCATPA